MAQQTTLKGQLQGDETIKAMALQDGIDEADVDGAEDPEHDGVWRPQTIFSNKDGESFSADTVLDRDNENVTIITTTNKEVEKVTFNQKGNRNFASCIQFKEEDVKDACVKKNGCVCLSAGPFHAPA